MHVITKRRLVEFWQRHPDAQPSLEYWYALTKDAKWLSFAEIRQMFPSADLVGKCTVFNIGGNKYRLIARIEHRWQKVYVRFVLTHAQYDRGKWKNDC